MKFKSKFAAAMAGAVFAGGVYAKQQADMADVMKLPAYEIVTVLATYLSVLSKNADIAGDTMTVWVTGDDKVKRLTSFNFANGEICEWTEAPDYKKVCMNGLLKGFKQRHRDQILEFACVAAGHTPAPKSFPAGFSVSPANPPFIQRYCRQP